MKKKRILQTAAMAGLLAWTSSSQAQLPVTDGLFLWLDATDPNTLFQDSGMTTLAGPGDNVALWFDKSGNDYHAFQDDDLLQPTVEANAINGNNSVRLDGLDGDGMYIDDSAYLGRPYTAFIVNQYWGPTTGRTLQSQDINWLHGLWAGNHGHFADGWVGNSPAEIGVPYVTDAVDDFVSDMLAQADEEERATRMAAPELRQFHLDANNTNPESAEPEDEDRLTALRKKLPEKKPPGKLPPKPSITAESSVSAAEQTLEKLLKPKPKRPSV